MTKTWRDTPDGRPVAADEDLDRHLGYPPRRTAEGGAARQPAVPALEPFIQGCATLLPDSDETSVRTGLSLFVLGAADRFWQREDLDETRFPSYARQLLQRFGLRSEQAVTLVAALPQLRTDERAAAALGEGAETLDLWLESRDSNLMLRVKELIPRWRRAFAG